MADQPLTLQEQLALLYIDGRSGRFRQPYLRYALAGAAMAELLRRKRIQFDGKHMRVRQADPIGDEAIDGNLKRFTVTGRPHTIAWWIRNFYWNDGQILEILAGRLVERGIVSRDERRALWVIRWHNYPVLEPAHGQRLRRQIREAVMRDAPVDADLATLIAILHNAKALAAVMDDLDATEIAEREHRIAAIAAAYPIPYTVGKAIALAIREKEEEARRRTDVIVIGPGPRPPHRRRPQPRPPRPWKPDFPGPPRDRDDDTPWTATV